jgi:hypothetical protein
MYCVQCGAENPQSGRFCHSCGKELFSPANTQAPVSGPLETQVQKVATVPGLRKTPIPTNRGKKAAATALIVLFAVFTLTWYRPESYIPQGDLASVLGTLSGVVFRIVGLIFGIRWRIKLAGPKRVGLRRLQSS